MNIKYASHIDLCMYLLLRTTIFFQKKALTNINPLISIRKGIESMTRTIVNPTTADRKLCDFSINLRSLSDKSEAKDSNAVKFLSDFEILESRSKYFS